jgi:hypothetical protein
MWVNIRHVCERESRNPYDFQQFNFIVTLVLCAKYLTCLLNLFNGSFLGFKGRFSHATRGFMNLRQRICFWEANEKIWNENSPRLFFLNLHLLKCLLLLSFARMLFALNDVDVSIYYKNVYILTDTHECKIALIWLFSRQKEFFFSRWSKVNLLIFWIFYACIGNRAMSEGRKTKFDAERRRFTWISNICLSSLMNLSRRRTILLIDGELMKWKSDALGACK